MYIYLYCRVTFMNKQNGIYGKYREYKHLYIVKGVGRKCTCTATPLYFILTCIYLFNTPRDIRLIIAQQFVASNIYR